MRIKDQSFLQDARHKSAEDNVNDNKTGNEYYLHGDRCERFTHLRYMDILYDYYIL